VRPSVSERLRREAARVRGEVGALYLACRDPRVPWYAKAVALTVVAYALSPIDLIPDFIPVLGLLDDLVLVPIGIALAVKLIPRPLLAEHRARMADAAASRRRPDDAQLCGRGNRSAPSSLATCKALVR